jgi:hypothetical protein
MRTTYVIALLCAILSLPASTRAQTVPVVAGAVTAELGSGYATDLESFTGGACFTGKSERTGSSNSSFTFEHQLNEREAAHTLGISAGGRTRFGAASGSASAKFVRNASSNRLSTSAVWVSQYDLPTDKLTELRFTALGDSARLNPAAWARLCGDVFVAEIPRGARLLFSIRVDFSSEEQKREFESKFRLTGNLYSANASLSTASRSLSKNVRVTMSAYQLGGDVSKLTAALGSRENGPLHITQCSLGEYAKCSEVVASALRYAIDPISGFPSQIAPEVAGGGAPLAYRTVPYESIIVSLPRSPMLDQLVRHLRAQLHTEFERQFGFLLIGDRLLDTELYGARRDTLKIYNEIVASNLADLVSLGEICYTKPADCRTAIDARPMRRVDESVFRLPPPPVASFRHLTTTRGLLTRAESVERMHPGVANREELIRQGQYGADRYGDLEEEGASSTVLLIEGPALLSAVLHFENLTLDSVPIPLKLQTGGFPDKYGTDSAIVVFRTNRGNPGWRDYNLLSETSRLARGGMHTADGWYWLEVRDAYGRETRFDLEYQKWRWVPPQPRNGRIWFLDGILYHERRNRWWDPEGNGTSCRSSSPWTQVFIDDYGDTPGGRRR